jgi:hypothetical protein
VSGVAIVAEAGSPSLEDVVEAALAEARARRPGRAPACPVCGSAMRVLDGERLILVCTGCESRLSREPREAAQLRLLP